MGVAQNMYVMLFGQMIPVQRIIVQICAQIDTEVYRNVLSCFVKESSHPGYAGLAIPKDFPTPVFVEDKETENNIDRELNKGIETTFEGGTYYFSTAQDPSDKTSVFADSKKFTMVLINQSAPTLLIIGDNYVDMQELKVEDVLPFAFPFGLGEPSSYR